MHQALPALVAVLTAVSLAPLTLAAPLASQDATAQAAHLVESMTLARDRKHRDPIWAELVALAREHDDVKPVMTRGLVALFERANRRMDTRSTRRAFEDLIADRGRLDELRAATLELVRDEAGYPYPYQQPEATPDEARAYSESQKRIDESVAAMRLLWESGSSASLTRELRRGGERVLWVRGKAEWLRENMGLTVALDAGALDGVGLDTADTPQWMHSLPIERKSRKVDLQSFALTPDEAGQVAHDLAVVERNTVLFTALRKTASGADARTRVDLETDQVARTNDYRRMLGLPALAWNRHLHLAVRNHAAYLVAVGHLGHAQEAPEFATIQKRAHSFGYSGPVWENCHHGSETAEGALIAWTHSSAHHRTILTAKLTEMATGFAEKTWVQKFGLDTAFESDIQYHPWRD